MNPVLEIIFSTAAAIGIVFLLEAAELVVSSLYRSVKRRWLNS